MASAAIGAWCFFGAWKLELGNFAAAFSRLLAATEW
jgi:hypothetical protein